MEIKKVCVVGGGRMGSQIALNAAVSGFQVKLTDSVPAVLEKVEAWLDEYLAGRVQKGRMTQEAVDAARARLQLVPTLEEAARDADLAIEAIIEEPEAKKEVFRQLDKAARPDTIFTSNSSYIVSSVFAEEVSHPERVANTHYFFPVMVMELVEICRNEYTSQDTVDSLYAYVKACGKTPVLINKEIEGFIANRILRAAKYEAFNLVYNGYASVEDVDTACRLGLHHPLGPFQLMDMSGVEITYHQMLKEMARDGKEPIAFPLIEEMYKENRLGKRTGRGWYDYTDETKK